MTLNMSIIRVQLLSNRNAFFQEQILAPLPARFGGVAHRSAFDAVGQSSRICQQWHPSFFGSAVALALVAGEASGAKVVSHSLPAARTRQNMVNGQIESPTRHSTILATVTIARENPRAFGARSSLAS